MKIILFDGSFKTTAFINRLAVGLSASHDVAIMGFEERVSKRLPRITYLGLGSNSSRFQFVQRSLQLRKFNLWKQVHLLIDLLKGDKKKIQQENLNTVLKVFKPHILHVQWLSLLPWLDTLELENTKVVLSERGSQLHIQPQINAPYKKQLQVYYPTIHGFHSVCNYLKELSNSIYSSPTKIAEVVYSGFAVNQFPKKNKTKAHKIFKILSVGRDHWVKGYRDALEAMRLLKAQHIDFQYTIIGGATSEELIFLRHQFGLEKEVLLLPNCTQQDVYTAMQTVDVLLLPSIQEGIANVCIEAMFCELPVLATACGGMKELIEHQKNGYIVPKRNANAMAEQLILVKNETPAVLEKLVLLAREKVIQQHSEEKMLTEMEALYTKIQAI